MALLLEDVTGPIIGAAIEVHRRLGPGFLEGVYENALAIELRERQIGFEQQRLVSVRYRGEIVGTQRIDLLVARQILVEMKTVREVTNAHYAVVRSYLHATGLTHGLILNFAKATLEAKRVRVQETRRDEQEGRRE